MMPSSLASSFAMNDRLKSEDRQRNRHRDRDILIEKPGREMLHLLAGGAETSPARIF